MALWDVLHTQFNYTFKIMGGRMGDWGGLSFKTPWEL